MINIPVSEFSVLHGAEADLPFVPLENLTWSSRIDPFEQWPVPTLGDTDLLRWFVVGNEFYVEITEIGQFLISNGCRIEYRLFNTNYEKEQLQAIVAALFYPVLIYQNSYIPMHCSALHNQLLGYSVLISGHSGAGKSTTSVALIESGWKMMADDVCLITKSSQESRDPLIDRQTRLHEFPPICVFLRHPGYK